ncbi:ABC transporter permease [Rhizosphaericola mali]|uniref:FtsX-like permease family protein n=1 Tax=Rhizosphaericola mali TaxID=2545455 RepID=A0A5P2G777_9BACT|nr:ABC transporter permease [Rhizosphaericola mali]QES89083.1 FtsX-like permease family protein [Rhizosphaericola mali]
MFKNYIQIAFRNLIRNKQYALLNIIGLSFGLAVVLIIALWTWDAFQFNKDFEKYSTIGQVMVTGTYSGDKQTDPICSPPFASTLRTQYGNYFQNVALATHPSMNVLANKQIKIEGNGVFAEKDFIKIFQPKMLNGNSVIGEKDILIAASLAKSLFGMDDPIGKPITLNGKDILSVAGVFENFSTQTSFYNNILYIAPIDIFYSSLPYDKERLLQMWNLNYFSLFVRTNPTNTFDQISAKIKDIAAPHETDIKPEVFIYPMSRWYLHNEFKNGKNTGGLIDTVRLFIAIGIGVLLLAITNFVNLATAQNASRSIEVGVRKAIGAGRSSLVYQFLVESFLFVLISGMIALILALAGLPIFRKLTASSLVLDFPILQFIGLYLLVLLLVGMLGGLYPAFYLSSFQPAKVLKGQLSIDRKNYLRKSLIVCQFFIATVLIFMTILVWRQINYVKDRPLGYDTNRLVYFNTKDTSLVKHFSAYRTALLSSNSVENVAIATAPVFQVRVGRGGFNWDGGRDNSNAIFGTTDVSPDFANTVGWQFVKGRNFGVNHPSDSAAIILNVAAANYIGKEAQIGHRIRFQDVDYTIIGIVKNPMMNSPFGKIEPSVFFLDKGEGTYITMRLKYGPSTTSVLQQITKITKDYSSGAPNLLFVDTSYQQAFIEIERNAKFISIFSILAIFIAVLGLFGLSSYAVEQKRKEIGIRKVLGASVFVLWNQFVKEFLWLIVFSLIVSIPISIILIRDWLAPFDYRTSITPSMFIVGVFIAIAIAVLAISSKVLTAVKVNPVNNLRSE